ncbi:hypothetical protein ABIB90_007153 [Bradyrhizobium sp. JR4.1]
MSLRDAPHVTVERDQGGVVDIGDRAHKLIGGTSRKRPIKEVNFVSGFKECMPYGIRYSLIKEQPERGPFCHQAATLP